MDSGTYSRVMAGKPPAPGKTFKDLSVMEKKAFRYALAPPPDARFLKSVNLTITCGHYTWNVHGEIVSPISGYIRANIDPEAKENVIDLSDHMPDIIARAIQYAYFEKYAISPDFEVVVGSKTVTQVLIENLTSNASSYKAPKEPQFDSVLHMKMYVFGLQLEMKYLVEFAQKKFRKALAVEGEGFWPCVEILNTINDEDVVDKVDRRLRHAIESRVFNTKGAFKDLERLRPTMAAKISQKDKRKFSTA